MDKDFHYYAIQQLAIDAGFTEEDAYTISFSSMYVDDCTDLDLAREMSDRYVINYYPIITQVDVTNILLYHAQHYILMPFHFLPGEQDKRNPYVVVENSSSSRILLNKAIEAQNLIQLGIALHAYADTFSHQNFTAFEEEQNAVYNWQTLYRVVVPNIGHCDVGHLPDNVEETWMDYRLPKGQRRVDNKRRTLNALAGCYLALNYFKKGKCLSSVSNLFFEPLGGHYSFWEDWVYLESYDDRIGVLIDSHDRKYFEHCTSYHDKNFINFQNAAKTHLALVLHFAP